MSATSVINPVDKQSIQFVAKPEAKETVAGKIKAKAEANPMVIVFVACIVAFHLAAAMVGTVAAWVYFLRN